MNANHIPHGAIEKTDYIESLAGKKLDETFFAFDGKVYTGTSKSFFNGMDWHHFCSMFEK